jgi:DNA-binding protein H-NS
MRKPEKRSIKAVDNSLASKLVARHNLLQSGGHMAKKSKRTAKSVTSMSIDALFKLRDEIGDALSSRAAELQKQLEALTGTATKRGRKPGRKSNTKGKKIAPQFRSKKDPSLVWSGRGANPRWMKEEMKGTKLKKENFRIK